MHVSLQCDEFVYTRGLSNLDIRHGPRPVTLQNLQRLPRDILKYIQISTTCPPSIPRSTKRLVHAAVYTKISTISLLHKVDCKLAQIHSELHSRTCAPKRL